MGDDLIRIVLPRRGRPRMSGLPAGLLAAATTQGSRFGRTLLQTVGRRRAIGIRAVCCKSGFQLRYARAEFYNRFLLFRDGCLEFSHKRLQRKNKRVFFCMA